MKKIPWNKGKKGLQVAWNKGRLGYMKGTANGMYKDGLSGNNNIKRKEKEAGRERPDICEVCYAQSKTDFDHDHQTGEFRGWLCRRCNLSLGMVKDNQSLLRKLADYLDLQKENSRPKVILNINALPTNISYTESDSNDKED